MAGADKQIQHVTVLLYLLYRVLSVAGRDGAFLSLSAQTKWLRGAAGANAGPPNPTHALLHFPQCPPEPPCPLPSKWVN